MSWLIVIYETFCKSWTSLVLVGISLLAFLICLVFYSFGKQKITGNGAWKNLGQRILRVSLILLLAIFVSYFVICYYIYSNNSTIKKEYTQRLQVDFHAILLKKMTLAERMAECVIECEKGENAMPREYLDRSLREFAYKLPLQQRLPFVKTWSASHIDGGLVVISENPYKDWLEELFWPKEKIDDFVKKNNARPPAELHKLKVKQSKLFQEGRYSELFQSLEYDQWLYIVDQIVDRVNQDGKYDVFMPNLTRIFEDDADGADTKQTIQNYYQKLFEKAYPTPAKQLKELMRMTKDQKPFAFYSFMVNNLWWGINMPYLIILLIIVLAIALTGRRIVTEGNKKIFK